MSKQMNPDIAIVAAGMDTACNIYRDIYVNYPPGNAYGWALNSGRMAAESALEYIKTHFA